MFTWLHRFHHKFWQRLVTIFSAVCLILTAFVFFFHFHFFAMVLLSKSKFFCFHTGNKFLLWCFSFLSILGILSYEVFWSDVQNGSKICEDTDWNSWIFEYRLGFYLSWVIPSAGTTWYIYFFFETWNTWPPCFRKRYLGRFYGSARRTSLGSFFA